MYTRYRCTVLHIPYLTYLLVRAIRSIDRSNSKCMVGEKKKSTRSTERESRYFFGQSISLHEITYISLEYPDGKTNKRESRRGNNDNDLHNNLTTGLLATHVAFPPPLKIDGGHEKDTLTTSHLPSSSSPVPDLASSAEEFSPKVTWAPHR